MNYINNRKTNSMLHWKKLILLLFLVISQTAIYAQVRKITSFDDSWRFFKGDVPGAEKPSFNDLEWRLLDVPHDWSIEGPYDKSNPTARGGGYLPAGIVGQARGSHRSQI